MSIKEPDLVLLCIQLSSKCCAALLENSSERCHWCLPVTLNSGCSGKAGTTTDKCKTEGRSRLAGLGHVLGEQFAGEGALRWFPYLSSPRWSYCNVLTGFGRCSEFLSCERKLITLPLTGISYSSCFHLYKPLSYIKSTDAGAEREKEYVSDRRGRWPQSTFSPNSPRDARFCSHNPITLRLP